MTASANNLKEVREAIASLDAVRVRAGGTKSAASGDANLCIDGMAGVLQYEPSEYTFTALAGTRLAEVRKMLAEHGQFMPFDPPFVEAGGTLGGTVAMGLSGSGRFRFGGIRDFLLGVQLVTHSGRVVFGGGKVVKNAAGFDIPKLMVGARGNLGVMTELTLKVFPQPETYSSLLLSFESFVDATQSLQRLAKHPLDLACLDLDPLSNTVAIRLGGIATSVPDRIDRVRVLASSNSNHCTATVLNADEDADYWTAVNEFKWLGADDRLVKVPITPSQMSHCEKRFAPFGKSIRRRYGIGGNVLWIGWPGNPTVELNSICSQLGRSPLAVTGSWPDQLDGQAVNEFEKRITAVFA
ncbi:FAD-binding protein [Planctomycetota bacterium]